MLRVSDNSWLQHLKQRRHIHSRHNRRTHVVRSRSLHTANCRSQHRQRPTVMQMSPLPVRTVAKPSLWLLRAWPLRARFPPEMVRGSKPTASDRIRAIPTAFASPDFGRHGDRRSGSSEASIQITAITVQISPPRAIGTLRWAHCPLCPARAVCRVGSATSAGQVRVARQHIPR